MTIARLDASSAAAMLSLFYHLDFALLEWFLALSPLLVLPREEKRLGDNMKEKEVGNVWFWYAVPSDRGFFSFFLSFSLFLSLSLAATMLGWMDGWMDGSIDILCF